MAGLQQALEARDHHWPATGDVAQRLAVLAELVMGHGQLDHLAARFEVERHARDAFASRLVLAVVPAVGEAPRRIRNQHLALDHRFSLVHEAIWRAWLPVGGEAMTEPVALGEVSVGQGLPELLRRRLDIGDVDVLKFTHRASPVAFSIRRARPASRARTS